MGYIALSFRKTAFLALISLTLSTSAEAQANRPQVTVVGIGDRDLRQAARRHRVPRERIVQARRALTLATEAFPELDSPIPEDSLSRIGEAWIGMHRRQAGDGIGRLIRALSRRAADSEQGSEYVRLSRASLRLASKLARIEPDRALQAISAWRPPDAQAEPSAHEFYKGMRQALQEPAFGDHFDESPSSAISSLGESAMQRRLARIKAESSNEKQQQMTSELSAEIAQEQANAAWDRQRALEFARFLDRSRITESEILFPLVGILADAIDQLGAIGQACSQGAPSCYVMRTDAGEFTIDELEYLLLKRLWTLRSSSPARLIAWLETRPELRMRLDRMGGTDQVLSYRAMGYASSRTPTALFAWNDRLESLSEELSREVLTRPLLVEQKLIEILNEEDGFTKILVMAFKSFHRSGPELSWKCLDLAETRLDAPEELRLRAIRFLGFIGAARMIDGKAPAAIIKRGFKIVEEMREAEAASSPPSSSEEGSQHGYSADQLEIEFIGYWALHDPENALGRARRIEDRTIQVRALMSIVEKLPLP